jgi:hypothetical protein
MDKPSINNASTSVLWDDTKNRYPFPKIIVDKNPHDTKLLNRSGRNRKMLIEVDWKMISGPKDEMWGWCKVLYGYLSSNGKELLYIGKAYGCSVRERWHGKERFWEDYEKEFRHTEHIPIVGDLSLPPGRNLTNELLSDVESLLIQDIMPWGNIQSRATRTSRPGMRVICRGGWRGWKKEYVDA